MTTLLLIIDAATGGRIKGANSSKATYGNWNPDLVRTFFSPTTLEEIIY